MIPIRDTIPARRFPFVMWLIILLNAAVFYHELTLPSPHLERFIESWAVIPVSLFNPGHPAAGIHAGPVLSLFSAMFLHGGWLHFIGNMWILVIFGDNVEDRLGHIRFAVFYFICGAAANFLHAVFNADSNIPTIGASGAIAGVMGAYFVLFPMARILVMVPVFFYPVFFEIPAIFYLFFWFLIQVYSGTFSLVHGPANFEGIAFWAHIGGFLVGLFLLIFFLPGRKSQYRPRRS
ncbi:rhomboid family intramembrane serine protease [bacterium]|nr:rhomboid family intramembrane serine protease [candidate division CSSED10-310 bacterium]